MKFTSIFKNGLAKLKSMSGFVLIDIALVIGIIGLVLSALSIFVQF